MAMPTATSLKSICTLPRQSDDMKVHTNPRIMNTRVSLAPVCSAGRPHVAVPIQRCRSSLCVPPQPCSFVDYSLATPLYKPSDSTATQAMPHLAASTVLFTASTVFSGLLAILMVIFPCWKRTRQLMQSPWVIAPIAIAYGIILAWSWQPDTFSLILPGSWEEGFKSGFNPQFFPSLVSK